MKNKTIRMAAALTAAAALATGGAVYAVQQQSAEAPTTPGVRDVSRVTGGTYVADPLHTLVGWRINHLGFNDYFGIFGDVTGTLVLDPADPAAARVEMTIPIASVTTASEQLNEHLLKPGENGGNPDFFGPTPPPATFVSTEVVPGEDGMSAMITGDLTLNGVIRPVTIDAHFTGAGQNPVNQKETIGFEGTATINRSDYGITFALPMLPDAVELDITAAFEKQ